MIPNDLEPVAIRVLGSLIEKELSTPDHYPLSLNALTAACNQSSNRDPIMALDGEVVSRTVDALRRRGLVRSFQGIGSRVPKFQHLLTDAGEFTRAETAILCVLMLRGPQTQGEVRTRAVRLMPGDGQTGLNAVLDGLAQREVPVVVRLARRAGQKEPRYMHLLGGEAAQPPEDPPPASAPQYDDRITVLEETVQALQREVADLRSQLAAFGKQFE